MSCGKEEGGHHVSAARYSAENIKLYRHQPPLGILPKGS